MKRIYNIRKVALGSLALSGLLFISMGVAGHHSFRWFAIFAHVSLAVFVTTEAFGPVAQQRSAFGRNVARLFVGLYALAGLSALSYVVGWPS